MTAARIVLVGLVAAVAIAAVPALAIARTDDRATIEPSRAAATNRRPLESPARWITPGERPPLTYTNGEWWILRLDYTPPFERLEGHDPIGQPTEMIRHAWDQDSDGSWDFSVALLGRHPLRALFNLPDVGEPTGAEVVASMLGRRWDAATFLAAERREARELGRIYEWNTRPYLTAYASGADPSQAPPRAYADIPVRLRGEYRGRRDLPLRLYLCPVDRKLHLFDAQGGLWNVGDGVRVEYSNLGGHYINQWTVTHEGRPAATLQFAFGQLVFADHQGVLVAATTVPPAVFITEPPRDDNGWRRLRRRLDLFRPVAPTDLRQVVARYGRPVWSLPGADLRDFRLDGDGFRFVLRLGQNIHDVPWLAGVAPGRYVVTYGRRSGYRTRPWSPADLVPGPPETEQPPAELDTVFLNATVVNRGLDDVSGALVTFYARAPGAAPVAIGTVTLDVPAGDRRVARLAWVPRRSGRWTVHVTAASGQSAPTSIDVAPVSSPDLSSLLPLTAPTVALLVLAASVAAVAMLVGCMSPKGSGDTAANGMSIAPKAHASVLLCVAALAVVGPAYYVIRSSGHWVEHDTGAFAVSIRSVLEEATHRPLSGYQHGYVYPAVAASIVHLTGMAPVSLLGVLTPFLSAAPAPLLFALFREFTGSGLAGALALLLLYLQPEYLFAVLRGTHEKFTLLLIATAMLLLVKALRSPQGHPRRRTYLVLFGLAAATALVTNALFAVAFFAAVVVALTGLQAVFREHAPLHLPPLRLAITGGIVGCAVLILVWVYPPAMADIRVIKEAASRLGSLVTRPETLVNPYAYIQSGWVGLETYLALSLANWLLVVGSATCWVYRGSMWFLRGERPRELPHVMLWLFYGAYVLLLVGVIVVDITGFLSSNMQHRIFPYFVLVAAPLSAGVLVDQLRRSRGGVRAMAVMALVALAAWCGATALVKAGNDPLVSNQWSFYTVHEAAALRWTDRASRHASVWTGPTPRLHSVLRLFGPSRASGNVYGRYTPDPETRRFVLSDVVRAQTLRLTVPLPDVQHENRIYDNGEVQVFHLRPRTPYQR